MQAMKAHGFPEDFDREFDMAYDHLFTICAIGQVVAGIHAAEVPDEWVVDDSSVLKRWLQNRRAVPDHLKALHAFGMSIAALILRKPRVAAAGFKMALGYATAEQKVSSVLALLSLLWKSTSTDRA